MKTCDQIGCKNFPCNDVNHTGYVIPDIDLDVRTISLVLISESAPENKADYYYAAGRPLFAETTLLAFNDAGVKVNSIAELVRQGVYLTSAVRNVPRPVMAFRLAQLKNARISWSKSWHYSPMLKRTC